jgi:hypothetical protein
MARTNRNTEKAQRAITPRSRRGKIPPASENEAPFVRYLLTCPEGRLVREHVMKFREFIAQQPQHGHKQLALKTVDRVLVDLGMVLRMPDWPVVGEELHQ